MILILVLIMGLGFFTLMNTGIVETGIAFLITSLAWVLDKLFIPINALVDATIPGMTSAAATINDMFDRVMSVMAWVIDATFLPQTAINLIVGYFLFVSATSVVMWGIKLVLKWKLVLVG